jgi:hypothetical protein
MPDDELSRLQTDIEDHLAATRLEWFRLATEPHTGAERNEAIDRIKASDAHLKAQMGHSSKAAEMILNDLGTATSNDRD